MQLLSIHLKHGYLKVSTTMCRVSLKSVFMVTQVIYETTVLQFLVLHNLHNGRVHIVIMVEYCNTNNIRCRQALWCKTSV